MSEIKKMYGCYTFNKKIIKNMVPYETYKAYIDAIEGNATLSKQDLIIISNAMKKWAIENKATHYTHWFLPLNDLTAEKHDSFLQLINDKPIISFSDELLIKGEPDASNFPNGGLRNTFEARGYTTWDIKSDAFIKDNSLYIPTLFCSYSKESLDNKTPLLRSCEVLDKYATKLLNKIGLNEVKHVKSLVGVEQEYFLIDKNDFEKRKDLKFAGRTLFGNPPIKSQQMCYHYCSSINPKIKLFMKEFDEILWKYAIPSKTKHNEAAPSQFEVACIYKEVNMTTDDNHLLMNIIQELAEKHGMKCLLHEKPFDGINGSGKHNNWSLLTSNGINIFKLNKDEKNNKYFYVFLTCLLKAIDEYGLLLNASISTYENDLRLGGYEAPKNNISINVGKQIEDKINEIIYKKSIKENEDEMINIGLNTSLEFNGDKTDRNRTSPFALTGNKFEFRSVGSSQSIAFSNTILNTILAFELKEMCDLIDSNHNIDDILIKWLSEHKKVIYNKDCYSKDYIEYIKKRGVKSLDNTYDFIQIFKDEKLIEPLLELNVFLPNEIDSRYKIMLEKYCKSIKIEAEVFINIIDKEIYPNCVSYLNDLLSCLNLSTSNKIDMNYLTEEIDKLNLSIKKLKEKIKHLKTQLKESKKYIELNYLAKYYKNNIISCINNLRLIVDELEKSVDNKHWKLPTYNDILFRFI